MKKLLHTLSFLTFTLLLLACGKAPLATDTAATALAYWEDARFQHSAISGDPIAAVEEKTERTVRSAILRR